MYINMLCLPSRYIQFIIWGVWGEMYWHSGTSICMLDFAFLKMRCSSTRPLQLIEYSCCGCKFPFMPLRILDWLIHEQSVLDVYARLQTFQYCNEQRLWDYMMVCLFYGLEWHWIWISAVDFCAIFVREQPQNRLFCIPIGHVYTLDPCKNWTKSNLNLSLKLKLKLNLDWVLDLYLDFTDVDLNLNLYSKVEFKVELELNSGGWNSWKNIYIYIYIYI